jgi:SAM-dependent MidA family methyltransferase
MTTPLLAQIKRQIAATGPMTLAEYMTLCLLHPQHGYYTRRDPIGRAGDFVTAPEVSQMFGEMIGLCLAQTWMDQGAPNPVALVELGPGRGTLMADILRATRAVPGFHAALQVHLVEASPVLQAAQAAELSDVAPLWHADVASLPDMPILLVANEFFDALPIRQFQRFDQGWRERVLGVHDDALGFGFADLTSLPALATRLADTETGNIVELCAPATAIAAEIGARIAAQGGAALIVDYGGWRSVGDTFQAVAGHAPTDPFAAPGAADLTAHVDFEALAQAAGCPYSALTPQGVFLERLGITARANALLAQADSGPDQDIATAHRRLTHPEEMGSLFKTLALYPNGAAPPPGLEPWSD